MTETMFTYMWKKTNTIQILDTIYKFNYITEPIIRLYLLSFNKLNLLLGNVIQFSCSISRIDINY